MFSTSMLFFLYNLYL